MYIWLLFIVDAVRIIPVFVYYFSGALCPMECQATEDLSDSDVLQVEKQLNMRRQRLSAAFVSCLTQTQSAVTFVSQGQCDSVSKAYNKENLS